MIYICKNYNIDDNDPLFDSFNYSLWHFPVLSHNKAVNDLRTVWKSVLKKIPSNCYFIDCLSYRNLNLMAMFNLIYIRTTNVFQFPCNFYKSSHRGCSAKKSVLRNFTKFTGNTCARASFKKRKENAMQRNIFDSLDESIEDIEGGEYSGPQDVVLLPLCNDPYACIRWGRWWWYIVWTPSPHFIKWVEWGGVGVCVVVSRNGACHIISRIFWRSK